MKGNKVGASPSCREYAQLKGVDIVGKLQLSWQQYGGGRKQRVYTDEIGTKYYPSPSCPTLVLPDGTIK